MAGRGCKKIISPEDMAKAEEYALQNCNNNTICKLMGWNDEFIADRADILARMQVKRAEHRQVVREHQLKHAKTSPVGAIWLGKQSLGQADKQELTGRDGQPLQAPIINVMPPEDK